MAYNLKYWHEYYDRGNNLNRIELHKLDYTGATEMITSLSGNPVTEHHSGDLESFDNDVIQGREIVFEFFCHPEDFDKYDEIFESEYRDWLIKWYVSGVQKFEGYVKPEQLSRNYFRDKYIISLSATDALADLKELEFTDEDDDNITNKFTILQGLKYCFDKIGIVKDFIIQLGTYESNYMAANDCALELYVDGRRFIDDEGRPMKCHDVIHELLQIFQVKLYQDGSHYVIRNHHELNSYEFIYDYESLTKQSRTTTDNIIDLSGYIYRPQGELSKIRSLNKTFLTHRNKDMGSDVTGMDLSNWKNEAIWTIHASGGYSVSLSTLILNSNANTDYIETAIFPVVQNSENDYLKITFDSVLDSYTATAEVRGLFIISIELTKPEGVKTISTYLSESGNPFESSIIPPLKIDSSGDYKLKISFIQPDGADMWTTATIRIKNVKITKVYNSDEGDVESYENVIYDKMYIQSSNKGFERNEAEFLLGDGGQNTAIGGYLHENSGVYSATSKWRTYGGSEDITIFDIYARTLLNDRYSYKNYLNLVISDKNNSIQFGNIFIIKGKYYRFLSLDRNSKIGEITAEIVEILTIPQSYSSIIKTNLNTVNGDKAKSSTSVSIPSSSSSIPSHNNLQGIQGSADGYHLSSAAYTNVGNLNTMAYEAAADYYTAAALDNGQLDNRYYTETEVNTWRNSVTQAEMGYLHGVTSDVQTQLDAMVEKAGDTMTGTLVSRAIYPFANNTYDLGTDANRWQDFYSVDGFFSGRVGIKTISPSYELDVTGTGRFTGALYGDSTIGHRNFSSGWTGTNHQMTAAGNLEIENLFVRGAATFRELIIDQLSIISGSTLQSVARGKVASVDTVNNQITLEDPNGKGTCSFVANDFFWIKSVDIEGSTITDVKGQISAVSGLTLTLNLSVTGASGLMTDISAGDVIVQRGHPSNIARQAMIYTTVSDSNPPFQKYFSGINSLAAFDDKSNIVLQEGNLASLASYGIVPASPGYGLYSDNVYLEGKIKATSGEIGGFTIDSTEGLYSGSGASRVQMKAGAGFWAGASAIGDAPFSVTNAGVITAESGTIGGWTLDSDAIYTGTKYTSDGYSANGITLASNGAFHSPNFYIDADGEVGMRGRYFIYAYIGVSDDLILSHDAEATISQSTYALVKTITLGPYVAKDRTLRIGFESKSTDSAVRVYARIYRNGSPVGIERSTTGTSYIPWPKENIANWNAGDEIQLYAKTDGGAGNVMVRNFRVYGQLATAVNEITGTNS